MRSKNSAPITAAESAHIARVKALPCSVCNTPGPSEAHHIKQGLHFAVIPICMSCHRGPMGWHGTKAHWNVRKLDELKALAQTIERLMAAEGLK